MKVNIRHSLRRTVAFVCALTLLTSAAVVSAFAEEKADKAATAGEAVQHVDDYTKLFPGLTDTKLKLSDPKFTEKDWYEYIEYEFYTEVKDGDVTYRIYQPTDYSAASIMAITDYNPKEVLGGTSSLTMNLGELQGVLDIAAKGGSISKEFAGLELATGIAEQMNSINDVMDNSKYYSSSSFLGIPGDKKYTGVSNDGFFNADSLSIEITETETVSACKTVAMNSDYSVSETVINEKNKSTFKEVSDLRSNTHEESTYNETSDTVGLAIGNSTTVSTEISESISSAIGWEISNSHTETDEDHNNIIANVEASVGCGDSTYVKDSIGYDIGERHEVSDTDTVSASGSVTSEIGAFVATSSENSINANTEKTNTQGDSSADSSTIEHGLTSGDEEGVTYQHANDVSLGIGYGVDYQYGNEHSLSVGVTRTFNAREDKEVKNVGWKLCEYVVKVPYYIEAVKTESDGKEKVLYGQYVNYNLLNGVSRGYIEHWYTGELVTYADFFNGFITATELVDMAKEQQASKLRSWKNLDMSLIFLGMIMMRQSLKSEILVVSSI